MSRVVKVSATNSTGRKYKCRWKKCQPNRHSFKTTYPNNGDIVKRSISKIHPNEYYVTKQAGITSLYRFKATSTGKWHYSYRPQVHHVIPGNMTKKFKILFSNLKLLNWDLNDFVTNGLSLPMYNVDMVFHDLQPHRGCHIPYDDNVEPMLKRLQDASIHYCKNSESTSNDDEKQEDLLIDIGKIILKLREYILNWHKDFILVNGSLADRPRIFEEHSFLKKTPVYPPRKWK
jgi:hypothetical protein